MPTKSTLPASLLELRVLAGLARGRGWTCSKSCWSAG
jgi:hypothetical protein